MGVHSWYVDVPNNKLIINYSKDSMTFLADLVAKTNMDPAMFSFELGQHHNSLAHPKNKMTVTSSVKSAARFKLRGGGAVLQESVDDDDAAEGCNSSGFVARKRTGDVKGVIQ